MKLNEGKKRVIITQVAPAVEWGKCPAKAVVYDTILSHSVLSDGRDEVAALAIPSHPSSGNILELTLTFLDLEAWVDQKPSLRSGPGW